MKCPKCQFENPPSVKFCGECGAKLEQVCSNCNAPNPPQFKFCGECGHSLTSPAASHPLKDLSFDEKLAKIQKYLPGGLTEKILSQRDRIEGERRHVTIMFVDMKGFTPLTEKLGPEATFSLMDKVFELLIHKIHEYEGTVNEIRGDGVLAYFGAPIALEDAPQRAIRSSLAIHRELTRFNDQLKSEKNIPPVLVRIGINSGPVVVGTVGNDLRVQFTAVGDTINTAARMEQLAEPGTTYVTEDTFKLAEGFFRFEALGEKPIKGKESPSKVYRVIAPSTRKTRFDVSAERGLSRFVGRERELEISLDSFERAKAGRGQAVSIMGEAGVGKSRLLYEFRKVVANEDITFLEGKCLSYGRGVAYHPIIDVLKSNFGVEDGDGDSAITGKVKSGLTLLGVDETSTLPYLLELLSVKDSGIDKILMSPEAKKDRICSALQRIILKGSEHRPLVFAIEDLHWMDKSSEDAAKYLMESIPGARVLMIFTYRPEFVHTWGGKSFHSQLTLNRLSNRESLAMLADLLGSDNIAPDLQDLILEKTEGVPFFIEEFVRSLRDMGIIERTNYTYHLAKDMDRVTIPSTIQDVIMARVDSLPEVAKEVLQAGSVIEREFSYELIKAVMGFSEQVLLSHLSVLKDAELLYERGIFPQSAYIFRHALTREVVYDSILTGRKRLLHAKIGEAIQQVYKHNVSDYYGILLDHFHASDRYEDAAKYARLASKKAEQTASLNDAILYAEKGIACLERLPSNDEVQKKIIDARTVLGLYLLQMGNISKAKEAVDPITEAAVKRGYSRRLSQIYTVIGAFDYWVQEDFPGAVKDLNSAVALADRLGHMVSVSMANYWLALASFFDCQFEEAFSHIEKSLKINTVANNLWGISVMTGFQSWFQCWRGKVELSYRTGTEAVRVAEQSGDIFSRTCAYTSRGISCYGRGALEQAIDSLSKGVDLGERISQPGFVSVARFVLAETCNEIGDHEVAKSHCREAVELIDRMRWLPSFSNLCRMALEKAQVLSGEKNVELERLHRYVRDNRLKIYEGWSRRYLGEILFLIDDQHFAEAHHWIEEAIEADDRNQMRFHLGRDYAVYAELFKRKGDWGKAGEQLGKAIDIYRECGADGWVTKAEEELARLA
jgi:class 3 adenylate cyclase/tetratricopeptide (TPR) repeat protein/ribosomal protein L40E